MAAAESSENEAINLGGGTKAVNSRRRQIVRPQNPSLRCVERERAEGQRPSSRVNPRTPTLVANLHRVLVVLGRVVDELLRVREEGEETRAGNRRRLDLLACTRGGEEEFTCFRDKTKWRSTQPTHTNESRPFFLVTVLTIKFLPSFQSILVLYTRRHSEHEGEAFAS